MKADKVAAGRAGARRTPEKTLWRVAILGGATGTTIGMHLFRHKTKKMQFKVGLPLIAALQVIGVLYLTN